MNLHRQKATHAASIPSRGRRRRGPGLRARAGLAWCAVAGLPLLLTTLGGAPAHAQAAAQRWDTRSLDSPIMKLHPDTTGACSEAGGSRRARRNRGDWPLTHLSPRPPPGLW